MIHAGQLIERTLHEQGRTVTWFATQLCCTRPNVYKIFKKENIDIHLLWRISCLLHNNFFQDISVCKRKALNQLLEIKPLTYLQHYCCQKRYTFVKHPELSFNEPTLLIYISLQTKIYHNEKTINYSIAALANN